MKRSAIAPLALVALALLARGAAAARTSVIQRDGVQWVKAARAFHDDRGISMHEPPAYPALIAATAAARGAEPGERDAQAVSILSGIALALAVCAMATRAYGERIGAASGIAAAIHPATVGLGSAALADGLAAALDAAAILAAHGALEGKRPRLLAPIAGALAAASYLVRPEGALVFLAILIIIALGPRAARGARARARDAALFLLPVALVALPYVIAIRSRPVLGGGGEGALKLTLKRDLLRDSGLAAVFTDQGFDARAAVELAGRDVARARAQTWLAVAALDPLGIALLVAAAAAARRRERNDGARRLVALQTAVGAALFLAFISFHAEPRYGARLATLALPHLGAGLVAIGERLGRRALPAVVAVAAVAWTPIAVHERDRAKATWRIAGVLLRERGARRVAALDPRPAFYAGAEHVDLYVPLHETGDAFERVVATIERERPDAVVLANKDQQGELALWLARRLGRQPEAIAAPDAEALVIVTLQP